MYIIIACFLRTIAQDVLFSPRKIQFHVLVVFIVNFSPCYTTKSPDY